MAQVVESRIEGLAPGDFVFNTNGWAEHALMGEGGARPGYMIPRKLDPKLGRISQAVGVLGMLPTALGFAWAPRQNRDWRSWSPAA